MYLTFGVEGQELFIYGWCIGAKRGPVDFQPTDSNCFVSISFSEPSDKDNLQIDFFSSTSKAYKDSHTFTILP